VSDPNVLVGFATGDDAAVYRLRPDLAVVQSVDLFPPVVDDAYAFGAISAANALSDLYAMGATPIFALSIVGFPLSKLRLEVLAAILRGATDKAREAGVDIVGGHSIDDAEPKFGLCVTGTVHPDRVFRNVGARPGDVIVLTKPIGSGVLSTALKRGRLEAASERDLVQTMAALNRDAAQALDGLEVHACTDVTGFGLLGHLSEMAAGSNVAMRVHAGAVPLLPQVLDLATTGVLPGGSRRNLAHVRAAIGFTATVPEPVLLTLADAQTSGGLLVALPPAAAARYVATLEALGHPFPVGRVGEVLGPAEGGRIEVAS